MVAETADFHPKSGMKFWSMRSRTVCARLATTDMLPKPPCSAQREIDLYIHYCTARAERKASRYSASVRLRHLRNSRKRAQPLRLDMQRLPPAKAKSFSRCTKWGRTICSTTYSQSARQQPAGF